MAAARTSAGQAGGTPAGPGRYLLRRCPLCGADNSGRPRARYRRPPWVVRQCSECNMVYLENPPPTEAFEGDLAWEKTFRAERERRQATEPTLHAVSSATRGLKARVGRDKLSKLIRRYVTPGQILDVGCGGGALFRKLDAGYVPFGIELSKGL
ncbi:MAG: hypothetical protein ACYS9X_23560, partial [Planctomycetota bacterium]